jgi:hypothetical protein
MLSRDWAGWHIIALIAGAFTASAAMITPSNLGITQITANWAVLFFSITGIVSAAMGNSKLPGEKEITAMAVGKAVLLPTVETKAAATEAIAAIPIAPPVPSDSPEVVK